MKRGSILIASIVGLVAVGAAVSNQDDGPTVVVTTPATTEAATTAPPTTERPTTTTAFEADDDFMEDLFLQTLRDEGISVDPDTALEFAHTACDAFRAGLTPADITGLLIEEVVNGNVSEDRIVEMGFILGAGTVAFCPEYEPALTAHLEGM